MPFISTTTNIEIPKDKEAVIKQKLGKAIELVPGKSEAWLMLAFKDKCSMYFKGQADKPIAFVEIKLYGGASASAYDKLTAEVTNILSGELNIAPDNIYIKYEEIKYWGWNGSNL